MAESLKAARERAAEEIYDRACEMYEARKRQTAVDDIAGALRELQRHAMEAYISQCESPQALVSAQMAGEIDALLDGPAPGEVK